MIVSSSLTTITSPHPTSFDEISSSSSYFVSQGLQWARLENWTAAVEFFKIAADQEDPVGQCNLALCLEKGFGIEQDVRCAAELYRAAAKKGHAASRYYLAFCYLTGRGTEGIDLREAYYWYQQAIQYSKTLEDSEEGLCYSKTHGTKEEIQEHIKLLQIAAVYNGPVDLAVSLGEQYEQLHDFTSAIGQYTLACSRTDTKLAGHVRLAFMAMNHRLYPEPIIFSLLKEAADLGDARALYFVGRAYEDGQGVGKDQKKAEEYFEKAALVFSKFISN